MAPTVGALSSIPEEDYLMSLYKNIANKKARIKAGSGETMRKVGAKGAPAKGAFKRAALTAKKPKKKGKK